MQVVWNGSKDHPGGRQLFAEEWPRKVIVREERNAFANGQTAHSQRFRTAGNDATNRPLVRGIDVVIHADRTTFGG